MTPDATSFGESLIGRSQLGRRESALPGSLRCMRCHAGLTWTVGASLRCGSCSTTFPHFGTIVDMLGTPTHEVRQELEGLAAEQDVGIVGGELNPIKVLGVERVESVAELMNHSRADGSDYYQHTVAAYLEALSRAFLDSGMKALEIGADRTFHKLRIIRELCAEAWALNIYFHVTPDTRELEWPRRVLGDMNDLPFVDQYFDLVIASATIHHTADVGKTFAEIGRVIRHGGRAVIVNEPVEGMIKSWGGSSAYAARVHRHEHIHETPITMRQWRRAIARAELRADFFVPSWYGQRAANLSNTDDAVRFGAIARLVGPVFRRASTRDVARVAGRSFGHHLLGLPLNAVLWKR
jgi:SAM-dependent methyltransferase